MNRNVKLDGLDVKTTYAEIAANFRYFATWRHKVFAGYLVLLFSLATVYRWLCEKDANKCWIITAIAFVFTLAMWALEYRNRDIVKACRESGKRCEAGLPSGTGFFSELDEHAAKVVSHTWVLDVIFGGAALILLGSTITLLYFWYVGCDK